MTVPPDFETGPVIESVSVWATVDVIVHVDWPEAFEAEQVP